MIDKRETAQRLHADKTIDQFDGRVQVPVELLAPDVGFLGQHRRKIGRGDFAEFHHAQISPLVRAKIRRLWQSGHAFSPMWFGPLLQRSLPQLAET